MGRARALVGRRTWSVFVSSAQDVCRMLEELQSGLLKIRPVLTAVVSESESRARFGVLSSVLEENEFQVFCAPSEGGAEFCLAAKGRAPPPPVCLL